MKNSIFIVIPILLGALMACSKANEWITDNSGTIKTAHGTDTVNIGFYETVQVPDHDLFLSLDTIYSDSRCPAGVTCIWAGAFEVGLSMKSDNQIQPFKLGTYPGHMADTVLHGVEFSVIDLFPYPDISVPVRHSDIRVRIGLTW